ncbi:hypothetical protein FHS24_000108 [Psychrobacter luti]|uniref:Uncharacterized protein n=1 Tax=Psychrobacter luti TaxID=198481 RepID=A0A839T811_9GAMM|nr:hypothetical protein [Psychrobacter luti]
MLILNFNYLCLTAFISLSLYIVSGFYNAINAFSLRIFILMTSITRPFNLSVRLQDFVKRIHHVT